MPYEDLREFIQALEEAGELKRIKAPVSCHLEITEITDRVSKAGGPALLFENVEESSIPVLINALGSRRRMLMALGVKDYAEIAGRLNEILDFKSPQGMLEKVKLLPKFAELGAVFPKRVKRGPCQEIVLREGEFDLRRLPILQCWPEDGGRFITFPLVFTRHPKTGRRNVGMYRMQLYDGCTTGMHWQIHKHGASHWREALERGERMPVAVAIGGDPILTFAAIFPLPDDVDEMMLAGFLRGKPVPMVKCVTNDLEVPATAEIVLEGYVDPQELRTEGPFGDHTGFYTEADKYPVFHVVCVTHRRRPIYQTTIVGRPPMEDCWMGEAVSEIAKPVLRRQFPEIVDMHLPFEGVFHNLAIVSIKKAYPGHARKIMNALWGTGQLMFTKVVVVVDDDVPVNDPSYVAWYVLNNIDPERDIQFTLGPVDALDHASRLPAYGSKMGIDATRKWPSEGFTRPWPRENRMTADIQRKVDEKWRTLFGK
ncbi:MAG: menaquinone biosynthesis decarboxylase [Chloracidobacterium sp.]|nr:menaquinone biosynthesis decarboxylase [Chloracidobacterium sp.]MDW8218137.1 menaquinone biosynthesis decarboxylase [Acidobacteriota bacterium]